MSTSRGKRAIDITDKMEHYDVFDMLYILIDKRFFCRTLPRHWYLFPCNKEEDYFESTAHATYKKYGNSLTLLWGSN